MSVVCVRVRVLWAVLCAVLVAQSVAVLVLGAVTQLRDCTSFGFSAGCGCCWLRCAAAWWICGHLEDGLHAVTVFGHTVVVVALVINFVLQSLSVFGACSVVDALACQRVRLFASIQAAMPSLSFWWMV